MVGAGLAGLACARTLADHGLAVTVLDKGRSPGGRATSRVDSRSGRVYDHGAQFFTAREEWLSRRVEAWEREGVVARWSPRGREPSRDNEAWWVGTPRMGALAAHLARGLDVRLGGAVSSVARREGARGWSLTIGDASAPQHHDSDALVLAVPAAQCAALLAPVSSLLDEVGPVVQTPCWAVMIALRGHDVLGIDVLEDASGPIAWAAREGSKPGRVVPPDEDWWTLHASTEWSEAHLEESPEAACDLLVRSFLAAHGLAGDAVIHARAHRWRYARGRAASAPRGALVDAANALVVCGDWLEAARVESALASGVAAANGLIGSRTDFSARP